MDILQLGVLMVVLYFFARWFLGFRLGAPYIPVRKRDLADAMELADLTADDVVVDLGSGDGRVLVAAAEKGARVIGYEINPLLCWIARRRLSRFGDRAQVFCKNLLEADLSEATVVFVFGITELMPKIAALFPSQNLATTPLAKSAILSSSDATQWRSGDLSSSGGSERGLMRSPDLRVATSEDDRIEEVRRGIRIISVAFELPGFTPTREKGVVKKYRVQR